LKAHTPDMVNETGTNGTEGQGLGMWFVCSSLGDGQLSGENSLSEQTCAFVAVNTCISS
jgi:hypothetical protein